MTRARWMSDEDYAEYRMTEEYRQEVTTPYDETYEYDALWDEYYDRDPGPEAEHLMSAQCIECGWYFDVWEDDPPEMIEAADDDEYVCRNCKGR